MSPAHQIVRLLLDAEGDEQLDPSDLIHQTVQQSAADRNELDKAGIITRASLNNGGFWHRTAKYTSRGKPGGPLYVRRNGAAQTWKRTPGKFRIPFKYGLYDYGEINNTNAHEWSTVENPVGEVPRGFYGPPPGYPVDEKFFT